MDPAVGQQVRRRLSDSLDIYSVLTAMTVFVGFSNRAWYSLSDTSKNDSEHSLQTRISQVLC